MVRTLLKQGAEARLEETTFYGKPCLVKKRFKKNYRHPVLDKSLTGQRMKSEIRAMLRCRTKGIRTPSIYMIDMEDNSIYMEYIKSVTVREFIYHVQKEQKGDEPLLMLAERIGELIGKAHMNNLIHGDLTTSNMLLAHKFESGVQTTDVDGDILQKEIKDLDVVLIDFGLSSLGGNAEQKGVDLYVLERALLSTHPNTEHIFEAILGSYKRHNMGDADKVIKKLDEVRLRGRKRTMLG